VTASPSQLSFFFDFSSPFAYLAATQVEAVAARAGARVCYRPFLLGGLFRDIGTPNVPLFAVSESKRRHFLADMTRWADFYGVPIRFPSRFPMNTVKALRIVLCLSDQAENQGESERRRLVLPMFNAFWAEDRDISDDAVLRDVIDEAGLPGDELLRRSREEPIKAALREATSEARQIGVCGAPSFLVEDQLFWGQDRLLFVEKALNGWRPHASA
jgi:2-hydroxychromene-2-carboxylate isomerase